MDKLVTFALVITLFLVAAVIAFTIVTNKIIKSLDVEINILKTANERLRLENQELIKQKNALTDSIVRQKTVVLTRRLTPAELENFKKFYATATDSLDFPNSHNYNEDLRC